MSSPLLNKAANVAPPIAGAGNQSVEASADPTGVFRIATSATVQRFKIPLKWRGRFWKIRAVGLDIQYLFGDSTVSCDLNRVSTVASEEITTVIDSGATLPAGQVVDVYIPKHPSLTHFAVDSSGTSGYIEIYPSDNIHADSGL